jgi:branched-chain amino acid transport system permease protein
MRLRRAHASSPDGRPPALAGGPRSGPRRGPGTGGGRPAGRRGGALAGWLARRWRNQLVRSLLLVVVGALAVALITGVIGEYRDLQVADGAYYFAALAGLTVLIGTSGQISLGHGAFMAVGAYAVALLVGKEHWPLFPALLAAVVATALAGVAAGAAASRLRGPYLAGATLAFAVGLPALGNRFPEVFGGENGLSINPPTPPGFLGASFSLERWEAWVACAGALIVAFCLYNLLHSSVGRSLRAVRDHEVAASLCGLHVARWQMVAFVVSAACAGLGGAMLAVVLQLAQPGAFPLTLSFYLLAGVVIGGLGSLWGAAWGAALLVLLPGWTNDLAHSFTLSTNVSSNLPAAIYGVLLIALMLLWPSGIQGALRSLGRALRKRAAGRPAGPGGALGRRAGGPAGAGPGARADEPGGEPVGLPRSGAAGTDKLSAPPTGV